MSITFHPVTVTEEQRQGARDSLAAAIATSDNAEGILDALGMYLAACIATAERRGAQGHAEAVNRYQMIVREFAGIGQTAYETRILLANGLPE